MNIPKSNQNAVFQVLLNANPQVRAIMSAEGSPGKDRVIGIMHGLVQQSAHPVLRGSKIVSPQCSQTRIFPMNSLSERYIVS